MADLSVNIGGLQMKNPVTVASGTFGYGQEYDEYFDIARLGAVTVKSLTLQPRAGNRPPRLAETPAGLLNAIGLQNVGIEAYLRDKLPFLRDKGCTIIANIYGYAPEDYAQLARRLETEQGADAIEVNLSCPNVHDARTIGGCKLVAQQPEAVLKYTQIIRSSTRLPLFIKLSPNVADIVEPCLAAQEGGADGLSLINTLLGMEIDVKTRRPVLSNLVGGLSGPAIRPVALKMVWDAARAVRIPIIGMGGICDARDAMAFLLAGASAIAVGSASFRRPDTAIRVIEGLERYLEEQGIARVADIIGALKTE